MNSGNPYAMGFAVTAELISGALSEPMSEFAQMEANVHDDNTAIKSSLSIIEMHSTPISR